MLLKYLALFLLGKTAVGCIKSCWETSDDLKEKVSDMQDVEAMLTPKAMKGISIAFTVYNLIVMLIMAYAILS